MKIYFLVSYVANAALFCLAVRIFCHLSTQTKRGVIKTFVEFMPNFKNSATFQETSFATVRHWKMQKFHHEIQSAEYFSHNFVKNLSLFWRFFKFNVDTIIFTPTSLISWSKTQSLIVVYKTQPPARMQCRDADQRY